MVRFRGDRVEGTLRPNVCALLTPLLRHETPLISLEAEALMEEDRIPMGGDVPVAIRYVTVTKSVSKKNVYCTLSYSLLACQSIH